MGFIGIILIIAFAIIMWSITIIYKTITGKDMDYSSSGRKDNSHPSLRKWFNDRKLSRRWQLVEAMRLSNEGKSPVKNKQDRFHITSTSEEITKDRKEKQLSSTDRK